MCDSAQPASAAHTPLARGVAEARRKSKPQKRKERQDSDSGGRLCAQGSLRLLRGLRDLALNKSPPPPQTSRCKAFVGAFLALLVCTGTAPASPHALPLNAKIKTIGIISAIGDTFQFEHLTNSPLEWIGPPRASFLEISDWGIDDLVTKETTVLLSKRYAVKPVKFTEADFDSWTWDGLGRTVRDLPLQDDDIDAYVLILRDWRADEIGHSVHDVGGLGLYRKDTESGAPKMGIYACYRITIVDAHTNQILASRTALFPDGRLPWLPANSSEWPKTQNDVTDDQRKSLVNTEGRIVTDTLSRALRDLAMVK